jgi:hypothetical protein
MTILRYDHRKRDSIVIICNPENASTPVRLVDRSMEFEPRHHSKVLQLTKERNMNRKSLQQCISYGTIVYP